MYSETTRGISVTVKPFYLEDQSSPADSHYVWAYQVRIENRGQETVQLRRRHWKITDSHGQVQEVRGPGVVGEQPVLKPGETFRYTSGTTMTTPSGIMTGTYRMVNEKGDVFEAEIPVFSLDSPYARRVLNCPAASVTRAAWPFRIGEAAGHAASEPCPGRKA